MSRARPAHELPVDGEYRTEVAMPLHGVDPAVLLRMGEGGPRGFWAREGRWIAHIGEVARVTVGSGTYPLNRYSTVWDSARTILADTVEHPGSELNPPPSRFFGGFAFGADHGAQGIWEGFPSAHFVLPEVELVGGREGGTLTFRGRRARSGRGVAGESRFQGRAENLLERLKGGLSQFEPMEGPGTATHSQTDMDAGAWAGMLGRALEEIRGGTVSKVVLARALSASFGRSPDPVAVAMALWRENPGAYVFLFESEPGHALVGAAPETLATATRGRFRATAVAGSTGVGRDPAEQVALARRLLASEKDRREQRVCVEDMTARLSPIATGVEAESEPHVLTLSSIQHLETAITARLRGGATVLSAVEALHPTPAVCGLPRNRALELIQELEPFHRGWYAGPVGWFDGGGDGVFVPALRSAVGSGRKWRLFSGAGIVAGSDPAEEWEETRLKFQPVLDALSGGGPSRRGDMEAGP